MISKFNSTKNIKKEIKQMVVAEVRVGSAFLCSSIKNLERELKIRHAN